MNISQSSHIQQSMIILRPHQPKTLMGTIHNGVPHVDNCACSKSGTKSSDFAKNLRTAEGLRIHGLKITTQLIIL